MKRLIIILIMAAHAAPAARGGAVAVPPPVHADMEASAQAALPEPARADRTLKITLSLDASPTNNVEAALFAAGSDIPSAVFGWDCGEWFICGDRLRERFAPPAATAGGAKTLTVRVRLNASGAPAAVAFEDAGSAVAFSGLQPEALLAWLDPRGWDALRVTSRGQSDASAVASAAVSHPDGTTVIVR